MGSRCLRFSPPGQLLEYVINVRKNELTNRVSDFSQSVPSFIYIKVLVQPQG